MFRTLVFCFFLLSISLPSSVSDLYASPSSLFAFFVHLISSPLLSLTCAFPFSHVVLILIFQQTPSPRSPRNRSTYSPAVGPVSVYVQYFFGQGRFQIVSRHVADTILKISVSRDALPSSDVPLATMLFAGQSC